MTVWHSGGPVEQVPMVPASQLKRAEAADADLRSLRGELANLLGPRKPREGVSQNDQWIAAVSDVLARAEHAEAELEQLRAKIRLVVVASEQSTALRRAQREAELMREFLAHHPWPEGR